MYLGVNGQLAAMMLMLSACNKAKNADVCLWTANAAHTQKHSSHPTAQAYQYLDVPGAFPQHLIRDGHRLVDVRHHRCMVGQQHT